MSWKEPFLGIDFYLVTLCVSFSVTQIILINVSESKTLQINSGKILMLPLSLEELEKFFIIISPILW